VKLGNIRGALDAFHHALDLATLLGLYTGIFNVTQHFPIKLIIVIETQNSTGKR